MKFRIFIIALILMNPAAWAKEIAMSFDDAPTGVAAARTKGVSSKQAYFQENEAYWDKVFEGL